MTKLRIEGGEVQFDGAATLFHRLLEVIIAPVPNRELGVIDFTETVDALGQVCGYVLASAGPDLVQPLADRLLEMMRANMMAIRHQMEESGDLPEVYTNEGKPN